MMLLSSGQMALALDGNLTKPGAYNCQSDRRVNPKSLDLNLLPTIIPGVRAIILSSSWISIIHSMIVTRLIEW